MGEFVTNELLAEYSTRKHSNTYASCNRNVVSNVLWLDKLKPKTIGTTQPFGNSAQKEAACDPDASRQGVSKRDITNPESIHKPSISASAQEKAAFVRFFQWLKCKRVKRQAYPAQKAGWQDTFDDIEIFCIFQQNQKQTNCGLWSHVKFEERLKQQGVYSIRVTSSYRSEREYT